jgi:hypothetical protein
LWIVGVDCNVLHDFPGPAPRIERYFNPSLAAGGDLLLGEKGASAASSGMNIPDNQRNTPGVCKSENVPQHTIPFNPAEIVCALVEPGTGDVTGAGRKHEENDQREDRFYIHRVAFLSLFRMCFSLVQIPGHENLSPVGTKSSKFYICSGRSI